MTGGLGAFPRVIRKLTGPGDAATSPAEIPVRNKQMEAQIYFSRRVRFRHNPPSFGGWFRAQG